MFQEDTYEVGGHRQWKERPFARSLIGLQGGAPCARTHARVFGLRLDGLVCAWHATVRARNNSIALLVSGVSSTSVHHSAHLHTALTNHLTHGICHVEIYMCPYHPQGVLLAHLSTFSEEISDGTWGIFHPHDAPGVPYPLLLTSLGKGCYPC